MVFLSIYLAVYDMIRVRIVWNPSLYVRSYTGSIYLGVRNVLHTGNGVVF